MRFCSKRTGELFTFTLFIESVFCLNMIFLPVTFGHVGYSIPYMFLIFLALKTFYFSLAAVLFFRVVRSTGLKNIQIFKVYGRPLRIL